MGLFLVHMVEYFELYWYKPETNFWFDFTFAWFGGKAYAIFALLFGVSYHIIYNNYAQKSSIHVSKLFLRRMLFLLAFGIAHSVIYGGDILQILALAGLLLIVCNALPNRWLVAISTLLLLQVPVLIHFGVLKLFGIGYDKQLFMPIHGYVHSMYANGSLLDVTKVNLYEGQLAKWMFAFESGRLYTIFGMCLLGLWLSRIGFFTNKEKYYKPYIWILGITSVFLVCMYLFSGKIYQVFQSKHWLIGGIPGSLMNLGYIVFTVIVFVHLYSMMIGEKLLNLLAPIGRMSLTVYIFQSIIFVPLFYGYGLALYSRIGLTNSFFAGIVLWVFQIFIAMLWLKRFKYGPLEWIWRMLTFGDLRIKLRK